MRIEVAATWTIAALFGAAFIGPQAVRAADIPAPVLKAPASVAVPASNWTGFYVSGGGGYGLWAGDSFTSRIPGLPEPPLPLVGRQGGKGWLGRVGGGFDYQFTSRIVAGVFGDYDFSSLKGTISDPAAVLSADIKQTRAWAVGARGGWLINPSLLSYFTVGYTSTHFSSGSMVTFAPGPPLPVGVPTGFITSPFTRGGWFLGGGAEAALGGGWFGRTEYRYAHYGDQLLTDTNGAPPPALPFPALTNPHLKLEVQTVTAQLVYKWNPGLPAPAASAPARTVAARWSGIYVNGGVGYGLWAADGTTSVVAGSVQSPVVVPYTQGGKGWLGRVGGGYDHQFGQVVAGVFADYDISNLKGSLQNPWNLLEGKTKETWSWAAGARAGWLITPETLTYVNAGYATTHFSGATMFSMATAAPFMGVTTPAFTTSGWFVGGGMEAPIAAGWFWRNEYRYARYDNHAVPENTPPAAVAFFGGNLNNINFKPTVQTVTTQLVYKFNWGG